MGNVQRKIIAAATHAMPKRRVSSAALREIEPPVPDGDKFPEGDGDVVVVADDALDDRLVGRGVVTDVTIIVERTVATAVWVTSTSEVTVE